MTDKVQKIREEVEKLHGNPYYMMAVKDVLAIISMQEEPVSEDILDVSRIDYRLQHKNIEDGIKYHAEEYSFNIESVLYNQLTNEQQKLWQKELERAVISGGYYGLELSKDKRYKENSVSEDLGEYINELSKQFQEVSFAKLSRIAVRVAKWQKEKDESKTEDLGEYINELSKQFQEVSFAKLSRIAVRVAKWQEQQFEKNRLAACDRQTEEEAEIEQSFVMGIIENEHRQPTFDDAIKYGMRLREQQMMAKAVDVEVKMDAGGYPYIPQMELYDYDKDIPLAKEGDKYKVILIKED